MTSSTTTSRRQLIRFLYDQEVMHMTTALPYTRESVGLLCGKRSYWMQETLVTANVKNDGWKPCRECLEHYHKGRYYIGKKSGGPLVHFLINECIPIGFKYYL